MVTLAINIWEPGREPCRLGVSATSLEGLMPVDFTANPHGENTGDLGSDPNAAEAPMFAPIPTWERNRKRRGSSGGRSGASRAAEPRSFAEPSDAALTGATAGAATGATTSDTAFAGAPTYADRRTTVRKRGGSAAPM